MSIINNMFPHADFLRSGISRVQILNNTNMGKWFACGPFIVCYNQLYMNMEESMMSPGIYNLYSNKARNSKVEWVKNTRVSQDVMIDVEDILSRFDTLGARLKRDDYKGSPLTIDVPTGSYFRNSVRKCYSLSSSQELAGINTVDRIVVRKSYYDLIYKMWGKNTEVYGKAPYLPVIFGIYDEDVNFNVTGILMPISCEHRTFEENITSFSKTLWEGVRI